MNDKERKDEITIRILQTALKLSIENGGLTNITMHQIAKQAGIGQATLYRRYRSIEEIFLDLLLEDITLLKSKIASFIDNSGNATFDQIKFFFACFIEFNEKGYQHLNGSPVNLTIAKQSMKLSYYSSPIYPWLYQTLYSLLEKQLNNQQPCNEGIRFLTHTLLSAMNAEAYFFLRNNNYTLSQIKDNLYTFYLEPICRPF